MNHQLKNLALKYKSQCGQYQKQQKQQQSGSNDNQIASAILGTMSMEDARSIFLKIKSTINGRPLIQNDERWLSPFEVAYGRKQEPLIKNNVEIGNVNKWMDYLSTIRNKFERLWKQQYLNTLAQRNPPRSTDIKPGDFVLLPAEYQKRKDWPLAKIISSLSQATMASYAPLKSN
ncbi:hypothetical protein HUG17_2566 [Dermatophagoides farinae]|uniref:DUF5641 domain-containing protein n=1 Tax=Dermatophagoides farinae TaxID=6954 RepID=A0A9D4NUG8_DERFA|nr:hypothetical protein HUG17_2566 [Dermatophagoides farinae]